MFFAQEIKIGIRVRFGTVIDIIVLSNISKNSPEEIRKICESQVIGRLMDTFELSEKFKSKTFNAEPVNNHLKEGDIVASTTVIFPNNETMNNFLQAVEKTYQV